MSDKLVENFYAIYDFMAGDDYIPNCLNHDTTDIIFKNHGKINESVMDFYFKNYIQIPVSVENLNVHWDIFDNTSIDNYDTLSTDSKNSFVYLVEPFANLDHALGTEHSYNKKAFVEYMSNKALTELKNPNNNFYCIVNFCNEGTLNGHTFDYLYNICERYNIPYHKLIFVIAAADLEELHERYCVKKNIKENERIKVFYWTWSIREKVDEALEILNDDHGRRINFLTREKSSIVDYSDLDDSKIRNKKFIMFNRRMREQRVLLISLLGKSFIEKNYISYDFAHACDEAHIDFFIPRIDESLVNHGLENMRELLLELPKSKIDFDDVINTMGFGCEDKGPYLDSYIHILSETNFSEPGVYFSEKTWKPIINLQPFISVNYYNSLHYLKSLGLKTFSPFIDESYDLIEDDTKRMEAIYKEIIRLNSLPIGEIHEWYYSIIDDLKYNREIMFQYTGEFMRNKEKEYILSIQNYINNK